MGALFSSGGSCACRGTPNADVLNGTGLDDEIYGRWGNDLLRGLAGNDWLDGGLGADRMEGGAGDDTYFVENVGDRTVGAPGLAGGIDLVRVSINWTLGAGLENLRLHGPAIVGEGNGLNNQMAGNGNANRLYGFGGNDTLFGLTGNDRLFGGFGNDTFVWTPSVRLFDTEIGADPNPNNELVLVDDGADVIFGGPGSDTYVVPSASFSPSPVSTWPSKTASAQTSRRKSSTTSIPASSGTGCSRSRTSGPATRPTGSSAPGGPTSSVRGRLQRRARRWR